MTEQEYKMAAMDLVPEGAECPVCGEERVDWLVWLDDETVKCQTCGCEYNPFEEAHS